MRGFFNKILYCNIYSNDFDGIFIEESSNNIVEQCNISRHDDFGVQLGVSFGNRIIHCNLLENRIAVILFGSFFNIIFSNNFVDNEYDATFSDAGLNMWLRNYWDNWHIPIPKPIIGIWYWNPYGGFLLWLNFDLFPRLFPYEN